jgi:glutamate-1-semialdehyde 2,1-aminomutase
MERLDFQSSREKIGHPGTFNANPLSAAAGLACLREVADGSHQKRAAATAAMLRKGMNEALARRAIPGFVYGDSSIFRVCLGGDTPPEARDYGSNHLPLDFLSRGMEPELLRLLSLAMINGGVHFFGNGGIVSSVHDEMDVTQTLGAWDQALASLRDEGAIRA